MNFSMPTAKGLLMSAFFLATALLVCSSCSRQPSYPAAPQSAQDIIIDTEGLQPDVPTFYTYHFQGRNISYFLIKIDNKVSSFFDACASCYTHKQGYRSGDGAVTCRYCNMKFPVAKLEKGLGGCYPIKIEGRLDKGNYLIPVATLEKMADKF
jgi:uncharacterized membrane protein